MPPAPLLAPTTDLTVAYRELVDLRAAFQARDWDRVRAIIAGQQPATRSGLIDYARSVPGAYELARSRVEADPADTLAAGMLGGCLIARAWKVRTGQRAQYVSRDQFTRFHEILRDAERVLITAAAYDPADCAVWVQRLVSARGLELGQSEARRRYDRLAEHDPHHLPGQLQLLQQLCPKWSGSFEAVHTFARTEMLAAPEGASNGVLVAQAHFEHLLDLSGGEQRRYRVDQRVREELREAAARSVLHPAFRPAYGWVEAHNTFAMVFSFFGDHAGAAPHFAAVGHLVSDNVWGYFDDPIKMFQDFRGKAMTSGGTR